MCAPVAAIARHAEETEGAKGLEAEGGALGALLSSLPGGRVQHKDRADPVHWLPSPGPTYIRHRGGKNQQTGQPTQSISSKFVKDNL